MDQPALLPFKQAPRNGFLLVEAALTAAVLAIGLIAITQGIGSSLRSLAIIQRYETLLHLAESKFAELEVMAQQGQLVKNQNREGAFDAPYAGYQWKLAEAAASSVKDIPQDVQPLVQLVTLTASPKDSGEPHVSLQTIWPVEWLQP